MAEKDELESLLDSIRARRDEQSQALLSEPVGEFKQGMLGVSERTARRIYADPMGLGVLTSESKQAPLRLAFPATLATRWMPGLFPDKKDKD